MSIDLQRIHALCLDVDGTLRDTDDQYVEQLARWLQPLQSLFFRSDLHKLARRAIMTMESPATALYSLPDRLGIDNRLDWFVERIHHVDLSRHPDVFWIVPQVCRAVQELAAHYPLAIISARHERPTLAFLRQFDLLRYFQCVATSFTCAHRKPYPDQVVWAAGQMRVKPDECLMIGDTTVDMHAGKSAGAQALGVLCGFGHESELLRAGADLILPSTADLPRVLLGSAIPVPSMNESGKTLAPHEC